MCVPMWIRSAASEGTTAHQLLEAALGSRQAPASCHEIPGVNPEMIQHVTAAWRLVAGYQAGADRIALETLVDPGKVFKRDDLWGTSDIVIEHGNHLTVLDFKYRRWPIDAVNSKQLQIYAIGAAAQSLQRIESFTLGVIQPRTKGPRQIGTELSHDVLNPARVLGHSRNIHYHEVSLPNTE
jgi:hypothetical protein